MTTNKTISEITKTVVSNVLVQNAQDKFVKIFNKKGEVYSRSVNYDLKNASLKKMDFTETEELSELGVINHLEIPTNNGRILYSFNESNYSVQTYINADDKKESLINRLKNNKDFNVLNKHIEENKGEIDFDSTESTYYIRELSDNDALLETHILTALVKNPDSQEIIGQIQYNELDDLINLYLGEEKIVATNQSVEITPAASCLVKWMNCMLKCLCGATSGSCAIAISGCIGACCGCTGWVTCIPCLGCATGVATCGNSCSGSK